eukprot:TRINITY_DN4583_c0_g1::TRINITY_DN4583_c0_g1_i1::g.23211::m.23211 TRINITY_DN4583_c0_g1::TRINITY_DN4583_c0_g1_i1::g.23211  ORF type:complete len:157 (-),score=31.58,sp/O80800/ACPM2_ARATH/54.76/1e-21,PP-binding/PF00550.20/3.5e-07,PP-binding_2/PF14573.1/0.067,DUF1493/PF07377.7/0.14 TRINITY_DN4583_c0_g1_i1:283-711(-)
MATIARASYILALASRRAIQNTTVSAAAVRSAAALTSTHSRSFLTCTLSRFDAGKPAQSSLHPEAVQDRVLRVIKDFGKVDPKKVSTDAHFINDLQLDSLDEVELLICLEDEFHIEINDADADKIHTAKDAILYILAHPQAK